MKLTFRNIIHILHHSYYIKSLMLVVIFTLMLVDVKSENWNFLKYGRIGKHPMQSVPCD